MITPDTKDWTWVLERRCPECGFEAGAIAPDAVAGLVRANAASWSRLFATGRLLGVRFDPQTWSGLEYACHVRDVYRLFAARISAMLSEEDPEFANWDQDATALEDHYLDQDPGVVVEELDAAAETLARLLESVDGAAWQRPGRRSNGSVFSVDSIARYMAHDVVHHVADVERAAP